MKRILLISVLVIWVFPALACNLPRGQEPIETLVPAPSVEPTNTPVHLGAWARSIPGNLVPTVQPTPPDAWTFTGLNPLTSFPEDSAAGALELFNSGSDPYPYLTQPGDTLAALARRFAVLPENIRVPDGIVQDGFLPPGTRLDIAISETWTLPSDALLPDSEIVYGPSSADFSVRDYIRDAGAYLASYSEMVDGELLSGAEIVERVAEDTSTNPRLLLAFLEFRSGWVLGWPKQPVDTVFPVGFGAGDYRGLYKELILVARQLSQGLYGWRSGRLATVEFPHGGVARISPHVNAGTAAVTVLVSRLYRRENFGPALYGSKGFVAFYNWLFGDPWGRASAYEPLFRPGFLEQQPTLELPFQSGENWNLTGGPHPAWGISSPYGALDFAPSGERSGCYVSSRWATAAAPGIVIRSGHGTVLLDLDGDGREQTGWVLLYLHLADFERISAGTEVQTSDPLGHPSCEGGVSTGTHVHIARKYNGEWISSGAETPFLLGGWRAVEGSKPYLGYLINRAGSIVDAKSDGSGTSLITR
jgi:LasA protease